MKTILAMLLGTSALASADTLRFYCNKNTLYLGEPVLCHFAIRSERPALEVEIVKFPEFSGFWKENLALRQGPMHLVPAPGGSFEAILGTYHLVPSVASQSSPELHPMIVALRTPGMPPSPLDTKLESEGTLPSLRPLPLSPKGVVPLGVGAFTFLGPIGPTTFTPGEPFHLRILVQGDGNFQEIDKLPLQFPGEIEVLSLRTTTEGSAGNKSKSFEWTLQGKGKQDITLPASVLTYFDPGDGKYKTFATSAIPLACQPANQERDGKFAIDFPELLVMPASLAQLHRIPAFWWVQGMLALVFAGLWASVGVGKIRARREQSPRRKRLKVWAKARALVEKGEFAQGLQLLVPLWQEREELSEPARKLKAIYEGLYAPGAQGPERAEVLLLLQAFRAELIKT